MEKIIMLGTGCGTTAKFYNTCFVIKNEKGNFLVDTGGSVEVVYRLKEAGIKLEEVNNIFISHSHTDHILGMIWILKKLFAFYLNKTTINRLNVYCNDEVYEAIKGVAKYVLPAKLLNIVYDSIDFHILKDGEEVNINGVDYKFFDMCARGAKLFGFECVLNDKKLFFLGDETLNPGLYDKITGADYVMHEAFCLDKEQDIFHPYEKHHSTVKSTCEVMDKLNVKNLILYHTEESHGKEKKSLYEQEGKENFRGNVIVPADLEEIEIK